MVERWKVYENSAYLPCLFILETLVEKNNVFALVKCFVQYESPENRLDLLWPNIFMYIFTKLLLYI